MEFKQWLESAVTQRIVWNPKITLRSLGIHGMPKLHKQGSYADVYAISGNSQLLVKITKDSRDVNHTVAAQIIDSPNIAKCFAHTKDGVERGTAMLMQWVKGHAASYSTPEFLGLIEGKSGDEPRGQAYLRILKPDDFRLQILKEHGKDNRQEYLKLSRLFKTLHILESKLGIFLSDFVDNIIDNGKDYIIVDFGL